MSDNEKNPNDMDAETEPDSIDEFNALLREIRRESNEKLSGMTKAERLEYFAAQQAEAVENAKALGIRLTPVHKRSDRNKGGKNG